MDKDSTAIPRKHGKIHDYAELAQITGYDRSRITRIKNPRLLSPEEQEALVGSLTECLQARFSVL